MNALISFFRDGTTVSAPWDVGMASMSSSVLWTASFLVVSYLPIVRDRSFDFRNRIISMIHAIICIIFGAVVAWYEPFLPGEAPFPMQRSLMIFSNGYFAYDMLSCLQHEVRNGKVDYAILVHHIATTSALTTALLTNSSGSELAMSLLLLEITNPSMHLMHMLRELKLGDSQLASANKLLFALLYLLARILLGPVLVYHTVASTKTALAVKLGSLGIAILSIFWFYKILMMATRVKFDQKVKI
eukprot:GDKH01009033.1.p1 GENE.GDKH01009033.1~~GDKH01009033.1.p1  ORF type:complete len:244 (-),score=21.09 GDKH01009033.1:423-1154(-)